MLGIDTGSYALKFCLSEAQGKDFALLRVGEFVLFPEKAPLTSEDIRLFFQRNRLPREATLSFSHPRMVFQRVSLPEMPQEELENTLQWEARSLIPDEENFQVGWSIVGKNGGKMEVLFAAVPLQEVERYVDVFSKAGVRVEAVEPHVTSLVKGFLGSPSGVFRNRLSPWWTSVSRKLLSSALPIAMFSSLEALAGV